MRSFRRWATVDARETATPFGQVVVAGASIAEVGPIVLLSLFFSGGSGGIGSKLVLLIGFFLFVFAVGVAILGLERLPARLADAAAGKTRARRDSRSAPPARVTIARLARR